jgi:hypothetical protein
LCRILSRLHLGAGSGDQRTTSQVRGRETRAQQGGDLRTTSGDPPITGGAGPGALRTTGEDLRRTDGEPRTTGSLVDLLVENANGLHVWIDEQLCAGSGDPRTARLTTAG